MVALISAITYLIHPRARKSLAAAGARVPALRAGGVRQHLDADVQTSYTRPACPNTLRLKITTDVGGRAKYAMRS